MIHPSIKIEMFPRFVQGGEGFKDEYELIKRAYDAY